MNSSIVCDGACIIRLSKIASHGADSKIDTTHHFIAFGNTLSTLLVIHILIGIANHFQVVAIFSIHFDIHFQATCAHFHTNHIHGIVTSNDASASELYHTVYKNLVRFQESAVSKLLYSCLM